MKIAANNTFRKIHYYPFGLTQTGISSKALAFGQKNDYKFNGGSELDETFGVNLYSTFFRQYDQQIGKFTGIDILAEAFSFINPYQFGYNNPVLYNDPLGALNTASTGSKYRSQKGPDGNYHVGWVTEMLWNSLGFFDWGGSDNDDGGRGGGGHGSASGNYSNIMGMTSASVLSQMGFGDTFGKNKKGEYGFWSNYAYSKDNGYGNTLGEVVVGRQFISFASFFGQNQIGRPPEVKYLHTATGIFVNDELIRVEQLPVRVVNSIDTWVDKYGRTVTRKLTLFAQYHTYTIISPTSALCSWSCAVMAVYNYSDRTPTHTRQWWHSKSQVVKF